MRLFGLLAMHVGSCDNTSILELEVTEGTTCQDVAAKLNLPAGGVFMFGVGGILKRPAELVHDGDEVQIFTPLAGG